MLGSDGGSGGRGEKVAENRWYSVLPQTGSRLERPRECQCPQPVATQILRTLEKQGHRY